MSMRRIARTLPAALLILAAGLSSGLPETSPAADKKPAKAILRRPVALVPAEGGRRLFVANRQAGTVSVLDVSRGEVIAEAAVGRTLADLADADQGRLLAVDEAAGELVVLLWRADALTVLRHVSVADAPVSVRVLPGGRASVACLWSRQLCLIEGTATDRPTVGKKITLPFAPREQLLLPGGDRLVVADAFGGGLAVVDTRRGLVESARTLPAHNIRGLAVSPDGKQLLLSQQVLAEDTPTRRDDIRWGNVISNGVRSLALDDVVTPAADLLRHSHVQPLGEFLRGAADPAALAVVDGKVLVALAGTGEVAFGPRVGGDWPRLAVGLRPTALAVSGSRAFVADTFSDTITVLDVQERKKTATLSLGRVPPLSARERGEMLFFDGRLSVEGWMSCHSCHSEGHTNGLRSDTLGDGSYGAPKRVPTLRGAGDTQPWTWNGSIGRLEDQVRQSIQTTMHGHRPTEQQVADLTAYLRSLPPLPPVFKGDAAERGKTVFSTRGCIRCHAAPTYTTARTYDVGLEDELGKRAFNPPSLRGVGHGVSFFHDGRASRLEDVFTRHHHQVPADMPRSEVDDLLAFLRSL